ncbi:MAG: hypothetical protein MJE63_23210 [Proteobacteria bacterium]|nr:hypothetical protein [Pseudomonadota bacterium]
MKIKAVVATTFDDIENGWSYTEAALGTLSESATGKPIIYRRKRVGQVVYSFVKSGKAVVEAEIDANDEIFKRKLFLVPGGLTDFETKENKLWRCAAHQFFLTDKPSDKELSAIEKVFKR